MTRKVKNLILLLVVITSLVFDGCKKSKSGTFQLQVQAKYGTQSLALDTTCYVDPGGRYIQVSNLQFYLSHLYLVGTNGTLVKVSDVSFFDASNPLTLTVTADNIDGDFKGITFYCGVDSITDTISPYNTSAPAGLLLGAQYLYWPMLKYQFESVDGKWDTACLPIMRGAIVYHVGGYSYLYEPVTLNSTFSVCCGSTTTKTLTLDFEKIFYNGNTEILSVATQGSTMCDTVAADGGSPNELAIAQQFSNNFAQAFSLQ